ncbi:hypothetical protein [Streptomyces sp. ISL-100]|uniref:hypothetical protein n=1 Tax=Streptomyces sp. ISL-100 TaxID=2819173 RepID=UPI001BE90795|nr:hypothetical protein [Streptomyces sp. ISL-100]MBT2398381.1 hypothetical protein [Streptomyces sp. ISL-100]
MRSRVPGDFSTEQAYHEQTSAALRVVDPVARHVEQATAPAAMSPAGRGFEEEKAAAGLEGIAVHGIEGPAWTRDRDRRSSVRLLPPVVPAAGAWRC